jgi:hypothetical protein
MIALLRVPLKPIAAVKKSDDDGPDPREGASD